MAWIKELDGEIQGIYTSRENAVMDATVQGVEKELTISELETRQRAWRNKELKDTDWIIPITDHSERMQYVQYRQALRAWPDTDEFPNTRPTL